MNKIHTIDGLGVIQKGAWIAILKKKVRYTQVYNCVWESKKNICKCNSGIWEVGSLISMQYFIMERPWKWLSHFQITSHMFHNFTC